MGGALRFSRIAEYAEFLFQLPYLVWIGLLRQAADLLVEFVNQPEQLTSDCGRILCDLLWGTALFGDSSYDSIDDFLG